MPDLIPSTSFDLPTQIKTEDEAEALQVLFTNFVAGNFDYTDQGPAHLQLKKVLEVAEFLSSKSQNIEIQNKVWEAERKYQDNIIYRNEP